MVDMEITRRPKFRVKIEDLELRGKPGSIISFTVYNSKSDLQDFSKKIQQAVEKM